MTTSPRAESPGGASDLAVDRSPALSATSRAAWVRERPSWSARKRSRRSVAAAETENSIARPAAACPSQFTPPTADSGSGAAGVLPPERDRQRDGAAAHRDVGHVERRPPEAPMPTSRKSTTPRALRIRSIRLPAAPPATSPSASWRKRVAQAACSRDIRCEHEHRDDGDGEEDPARVGAEVEAERRALVVHQPELEPVAEHRDARRPQQRGLGDQLGDQVEHDHADPRPPRRSSAPGRPSGQRRFPSSSFSLQVMQSRAWGSASSRSKLMSWPH